MNENRRNNAIVDAKLDRNLVPAERVVDIRLSVEARDRFGVARIAAVILDDVSINLVKMSNSATHQGMTV